jgi:hypothetical protein
MDPRRFDAALRRISTSLLPATGSIQERPRATDKLVEDPGRLAKVLGLALEPASSTRVHSGSTLIGTDPTLQRLVVIAKENSCEAHR